MRVLLTGRDGQVGWELERSLAPLGDLRATGRAELDLLDEDRLRKEIREYRPEVIVNAAAYTAVDRAEDEPELAMRVNARAPEALAAEAKKLEALLVHFSTDYVFDGEKPGPYVEDDPPHPRNVYGETKLAGERAIAASGCTHLILRTSWVYSHRGKNFLLSILRAAREGRPLRVVSDQRGAPTCAAALARATVRVLADWKSPGGTFHLSAGGETSWHGFAQEILRLAGIEREIAPISSAAYGARARRPRNSTLDNAKFRRVHGFALPDWRAQLGETMAQVLR